MNHAQFLAMLGLPGQPCGWPIVRIGSYSSPVGLAPPFRLRLIEVRACLHCDLAFEVSRDGPGVHPALVASYPLAASCRPRRP